MTKALTKLSLTSFNPKRLGGMPDGTQELYLGRLIGNATGLKKAYAQDGVTEMFGLKGQFGAKYNSTDKDGTPREDEHSGVLYLHSAYMEPIIDLFEDEVNEDGEVITAGVSSVDVAYDVFVVKAANPAGYSWSLRPLLEPSASDPLAAIAARIPPFNNQGVIGGPAPNPQISDQSTDKAENPTDAAKGKGTKAA